MTLAPFATQQVNSNPPTHPMSIPPNNPPAGSAKVVKIANNAVARKGARALQELALQAREGEWVLQINLALTPASGRFGGSPGTDDPGKDVPNTDDPGKNVPATDDPGKDVPNTDDPGKNVPDSGVTGVAVHAPIELRGATISVRFATHAACVHPTVGEKPADGKAKRKGKNASARKSVQK